MSCFFCESNYHLSQNCEIHESDESRKEIAQSKNCCEFCLNYMGDMQSDAMLEKNRCPRCVKTKGVSNSFKTGNCITCFSMDHDTVFCPSRFKAPKLFIPNINKDLLPRFIQIFDHLEQYPIAFSSPTTQNLIPIKTLKFIENIDFNGQRNLHYFWNKNLKKLLINIVLIGTIRFNCAVTTPMKILFDHISLKIVVVKAEIIIFDNFEISFEIFLQFFSHQTKVIKCNSVQFVPSAATVTLGEIFEKTPNLEKFEFLRTNANIDFSWLKDLKQRKNKETLMEFRISISDLKFSAMDLAIYMTQPSIKNIFISLYLDEKIHIPFEKLYNDINDFLTDHFVQRNGYISDEPCLFIAQQFVEQPSIPIGYFTLA